MAMEWNLLPLHIESDCAEAIKAILFGQNFIDKNVSTCRLLMHQGKEMTLQHTFRECNKVAHELSKMEGSDEVKKKVFVKAPFVVSNFVTYDLDKDRSYIKYLPMDACNMLASLGNQSVLSDTIFGNVVTNVI